MDDESPYGKDSPYYKANRPTYDDLAGNLEREDEAARMAGTAGGKGAGGKAGGKDIHRIEETIDVDVPVRACYDQWTQFEEFPRFMEGIEQVEQVDDTHLHWVAMVAGQRREWDAEILEQEPDRLISWRSTSGDLNNGTVEFLPNEGGCRIRVTMTYGVSGFAEKVGDALGFLKSRVHGDLKRFKKYIESHRTPTGAWRGEVHGGRKQPREPRSRTHRGSKGTKGTLPGTAGTSSQFDKPF